jgi:hypothetical protein
MLLCMFASTHANVLGWMKRRGLSIFCRHRLFPGWRCAGLQFAAADERPRQFISMSQEEVEAVVAQVQDGSLKHTLQFGIGLHHAGLSEKDRTLVEELFVNNKIQVPQAHTPADCCQSPPHWTRTLEASALSRKTS